MSIDKDAELKLLRQALWDCFRAIGGDCDGDAEPHCSSKDLARTTLEAVKEEMRDYRALVKDLGEGIHSV